MLNGREYYLKYKKQKDKYNRVWRKRHPEKLKNKKLIIRHGITLEQYMDIFNKQNGCCAICNIPQLKLKVSLVVDHNHEDNIIRGLLCHSCNLALGLLRDSKEILNSAIKYLER